MNKLTKVLSVFVLAGAIGAGMTGIAGCTKTEEHKHDYEYTQISGNAEKHNVHCKNDGHEGGDTQENHVWKDGKCEKCDYPQPSAGDDKLEVAANVTGLIIEGVSSETITLSETKKSHTIDKSAIKVYFATGANADVKGTEVPAANVVLELKDSAGAAVSSWENISKDGAYKVNASLKDVTMASGATATVGDLKATVTVTISNPAKKDTLAVKSGTLTQGASVQNKMSVDWKYEVTLANGDKQDFTEAVNVTVDTQTVGKQTATLKSGEYTGSVEVTITAAVIHKETYAVNFSAKENGEVASQDPAATAVEIFKSANGKTKLEARGVKVENNGNSAAQECDGKFFAKRAPFEGATFTAAGALQVNQRYYILTTEGAAKLTIYWSRNSSKDERGVAVFDSAAVEGGDISKLTPTTTNVAKATVMGDGTAATQGIQKTEVNLPKAGTYWITTANNQNAYLYYMELTTEFDGEGTDVTLEAGAKSLAKVTVSHTTADFKQEFTVGSKFTVDSGYSFKGTFVAANTAAKTEEDLTEVTYWAGDTQLIPDTTVLTADMFTALGDNTVTVKYGNETVTGSYTISVVNALGVNGVNAALKSGVTTEVAKADSKVTITWANFDLSTTGENTNVNVVITSASYVAKDAAAGTEGTAIAEAGTAIGVGDYVVTFNVTVTDKTNSALTDTFTATCNLKISLAGALASWLYQTDNATVGATNPNIDKNAVVAENGSFKAEALDSAKSGYNRNSAFEANITDSANTTPGANKPVAAASDTASGEEMVFTNAVAFDTKGVEAGTDYLKITAKKATTVYVYLNASDDGHKSNRSGAQVYYSVNGTACSADKVITVGNRKAVTVVKVTLAANDVLVVSAKKGTCGSDPRIWFYGIEAVDVA